MHILFLLMKTSSVSVGEFDYTVSIHAKLDVENAPVLVYVNLESNQNIGCYIYTIGRGLQTYSTVLQGAENGDLHDFATTLGRVLVKKLGRPSYVCMSGDVSVLDTGLLVAAIISHVK